MRASLWALLGLVILTTGVKSTSPQPWTAVTRPSLPPPPPPPGGFPVNHRRGVTLDHAATVSSMDINALATPPNITRRTSQTDRGATKFTPDDAKRRHRPGMVTNLGEIPLNDDGPARGPARTPTASPSALPTSRGTTRSTPSTTEIYLVTSPPRSTKATAPSKRAGSSEEPGMLRQEPWVLPLLVISAITAFTMAAFEVFVLCRARRAAPSRRHLFLGQMLLLGVFLCAALAGLQAATPTPATCALTRLGAGLAYALVFASLLVKSVFLISLNGGVYLPAPYQALLLLFAVLIQVAVGAQWLLNSPPRLQQETDSAAPTAAPRPATGLGGSRHVITASDVTPVKGSSPTGGSGPSLCATPYSETLAALIYVVFLMGFVGVLAAKSRGIRENYRESTYIGLSVACCAPLWLGWALAGLALGPRHQDACLGFGLLATALVVFSLMFLPRGRQLAAMGRDGRYAEDGGEERFSSLSPSAVAGYSPSFFHFKPPPPSNTLPTKHGAPTSGNGHGNGGSLFPPHLMGDRVALVGPPPPPVHPPPLPMPLPPSYPRLLHYYPCLYYPPRYPGLYMKPEDGNMYTTLEPTLSSNPNVFFQRGGVHPGMMY